MPTSISVGFCPEPCDLNVQSCSAGQLSFVLEAQEVRFGLEAGLRRCSTQFLVLARLQPISRAPRLTASSPEQTHGPWLESAIANLHRAGSELGNCATKLPLRRARSSCIGSASRRDRSGTRRLRRVLLDRRQFVSLSKPKVSN